MDVCLRTGTITLVTTVRLIHMYAGLDWLDRSLAIGIGMYIA